MPTNRYSPSAVHRTVLGRHLLLILFVVGLIAGSIAFLAYANWQQQDTARSRELAVQEDNARIDKSVEATLQKRIDDAKNTEQLARERSSDLPGTSLAVPFPQTNTQICDVTNPTSLTVVINKKHCFSPKNWTPTNLVSLNGYFLQNEASQQLARMMNDAEAAGAGFSLSSAYRSYENQVVTYDTWVRINGSIVAADTVSARPGFSEHQTGLAVDLKVGNCVLECFSNTPSYTWLQQNAANYGYIERYPPGLTAITGYVPESWHWRYVGIITAQDMKSKGIETLETYLNISGGDYL